MNSDGHENAWSSDGGRVSTIPLSIDGYASGTARGELNSSVFGEKAYQVVENGGDASVREEYTDSSPDADDSSGVELLSNVDWTNDKPRRGQVTDVKHDYDSDDSNPNDRWMLNVWGLPNVAVMLSYFSVGFAMRFLSSPLTFYLVHVLGASPAQVNVFLTLGNLPWSFKLVYGFVSDNFPIRNMRRKPYFIIGWTVFVLANFITATQERPSVQLLCVSNLVSTMGFMMSDVSMDAILVERSKHEPRETRGSMQATGYNVRFIGSLLGSVMGMTFNTDENCAVSTMSIRTLLFFNGLFPVVCVMPFMWHLRETSFTHANEIPVKQRLWEQSTEVFKALEQKALYGPLAFIFLYNVFQVPNAAWKPFLVEGLSFTSCQLGCLVVVASLMSSVGLWTYKAFFFHSSWRKIYVWTTLVVALFSGFQLLLIFRVNVALGISDLAFSIGDDSIADLVSSIQFLPVVRMYISMCPDGVEGTTYAILTTMSNVAAAVAYNVGTLITKLWDVSNEALSEGDFKGMWKLTLLTSLLQPLPLFLVRMLPANMAEQRALQASGIRNKWGGIILLTVLFGSLGWTVILAIIELT